MPFPTRTSSDCMHQRGGVMMVMLVILVLGITTVFITSLSGTAMQNKRNQTTADALAKAKEALIGYAVSDPNRPGELPCPDTNDDGSAESNCSFGGGTLIGRLPWRTLDLPDPRDGASEKLWYIVSENFHANSTSPINSDTTGTISINGTADYAAVVLAPGAALPNQSRPNPPTGLNTSATYLQFLEDITQTTIQTQSPNDIPGGAYTYNDQLLSLRPIDFMPLIEKRIVREAKKCLDDFAATVVTPNTTPGNKYPWAVPLNDTTASPNRSGTQNIRFGRFPDSPNNSTAGGGSCPSSSSPLSGFTPAQITTLNNYIQLVQNALNNYIAGGSKSSLKQAGDNLKDVAKEPPYNLPYTDPIRSLGSYVDNNCGSTGSCNTTTIQTMLDAAFSEIAACTGGADSTMPTSWSCQLTSSSYWNYWRDSLFMQIADGYQPGAAGACTTNTTCLSITGSGNTSPGSGSYHAVVAIARGIIPAVNTSPRNTATLSDYLEGANQLNKTGASPAVAFETYRTDDMNYGTVNDLVLCLDGSNNCR